MGGVCPIAFWHTLPPDQRQAPMPPEQTPSPPHPLPGSRPPPRSGTLLGPGTPRTRIPLGADTPPQTVHAGRYGQQAGGMHPTGMQSCLFTYGACAAGHYVISEIFDGWMSWTDSEAGGKHPSTVETRLPTFVVRNDICKESIDVVTQLVRIMCLIFENVRCHFIHLIPYKKTAKFSSRFGLSERIYEDFNI